MTISDRIYLFLAEDTPQYQQLVDIVGAPSCASPSVSKEISPSDEYVAGINIDLDIEPTCTKFQDRLSVYGDLPVRTFSIMC